MESEGEPGAGPEKKPASRKYGDWVTRTLGPDWVEVEPGIFQPPDARAPEPDPDPQPAPAHEHESLDEALWPKAPQPARREPVAARSKRGWWRRG